MHILVDTNILLDYAFNKAYAINFFDSAIKNWHEVYIAEDVYAEAKNLAPNFEPIRRLIERLTQLNLYHKVRTNKKLNNKTELFSKKCIYTLGHDIDTTDRKLIVLALRHDLMLYTNDKELLQMAKLEKCKVLTP